MACRIISFHLKHYIEDATTFLRHKAITVRKVFKSVPTKKPITVRKVFKSMPTKIQSIVYLNFRS